MPFKSKAQQKYLFKNKPKVAQEFADATSKEMYKKLPKKVTASSRKKVNKMTSKKNSKNKV